MLLLQGLGRLALRAAGQAPPAFPATLAPAWLGLAALVAGLQLWHLAAPVDGRAVAVAVVPAALGWVLPPWPRVAGITREWRLVLALAVAVAVALLVLARAGGELASYDAGLYHVTATEWAHRHAIVPGLGNLHGRLGFNSTQFLLLAFVDNGPWQDRAHHVLAAATVALLALEMGLAAGAMLARRRWGAAELFLLVMAVPVLRQAFKYASDTSPDFMVLLLAVASTRCLLGFLVPARGGTRDAAAMLLIAGAVSAAAATVKLSFAAWALGALLVATAAALRRPRMRRALAATWLAVLVVGVPWCARGYLLTGYPAYPSTVLALSLPWSVPAVQAVDDANWVRSFARDPGRHWQEVLANHDWVGGWASTVFRTEWRDTTLPLLIALAALAIALARRRGAGRLPAARASLALAAPLLATLLWLWVAPAPRFALANFWALAGIALAAACAAGRTPRGRRWGRRAGLAFAVLAVLGSVGGKWWLPPAADAWQRWPTPAVTARVTDSGLTVYVPAHGEQCFAAPLPCTPYFNPSLAARTPGHPDAGFRVTRPPATYASPSWGWDRFPEPAAP